MLHSASDRQENCHLAALRHACLIPSCCFCTSNPATLAQLLQQALYFCITLLQAHAQVFLPSCGSLQELPVPPGACWHTNWADVTQVIQLLRHRPLQAARSKASAQQRKPE
jgi:hypothetical protein